MVFHAKAVEVYSSTFQTLERYDLERDLEVGPPVFPLGVQGSTGGCFRLERSSVGWQHLAISPLLEAHGDAWFPTHVPGARQVGNLALEQQARLAHRGVKGNSKSTSRLMLRCPWGGGKVLLALT